MAINLTELPPPENKPLRKQPQKPAVLYNFANNYIDIRTFNAALWRRCINNALKEPENIATYGQAQGEIKLRETLAKYSYEARGVIAAPEQIIIGAGVQSLLEILIGILQPEHNGVRTGSPWLPAGRTYF